MNKKIIFSSGGTGGHIFPTIGVMQYFLKKGYSSILVTDLRGNQYLKNNLEIKSYILNTDTPLNKKNYKKFFSYIKIFLSIIKSLFLLKKEKPNLVFGLGGYVSFPISVAAKMLNIPLIIYENNMVLGRTNSYLLPFAKKILLATDTISNYPPKYKTKIKKVGHVIREDILNYSPLQNKKQNGHFSILVLGGSQGAEIFGIIIPKVIKRMNENGFKIKIYHQCIKNQEEKLKNFYRENNISNNVFEFTGNILEFILKFVPDDIKKEYESYISEKNVEAGRLYLHDSSIWHDAMSFEDNTYQFFIALDINARL